MKFPLSDESFGAWAEQIAASLAVAFAVPPSLMAFEKGVYHSQTSDMDQMMTSATAKYAAACEKVTFSILRKTVESMRILALVDRFHQLLREANALAAWRKGSRWPELN